MRLRIADAALVEVARREDRVVLTADRRMRPLLESSGLAWLIFPTSKASECIKIMHEGSFPVQFSPWSRCMKCNIPLADLARADLPNEWIGRVPATADLYTCAGCGGVFWEGSHVRRLDSRLRSIAGGSTLVAPKPSSDVNG